MKRIIYFVMVCGLVFIGCKNNGTSPSIKEKEVQVKEDVPGDSDDVLYVDLDSLDDPCKGLSSETTMDELFPDGLLEVELCLMDEYPDVDWENRQEWKDGVNKMWKWHDKVKKKMDIYLESSMGDVAPHNAEDYERVLVKLEDGYNDYSCCGPMSIAAKGWTITADYRLISMYKTIISHTQNTILERAYYDDYCFWARFGLQCVREWRDEALKEQSYYTMLPVECEGILNLVASWRKNLLKEEDALIQGKSMGQMAKSAVKTDTMTGVAKEWYQYRKKVATQINKKDATWFDYMTERIILQYSKKNFFPEY
ncbi:MAG: hypothetical protein IJV33_00275 [Bacteroidaceae bacterium]|nr:hypothetical protein [Bacteroidaceae bacterium]